MTLHLKDEERDVQRATPICRVCEGVPNIYKFSPLFEREGERNGRERCSETLAEEPQEAVLVGVEEAPAIQLPLQNVWVRTLAHL